MKLDDYLNDMNAVYRGEYYTVRCPICGKKEAYIYLDDIKKNQKDPNHKISVRCNRLNKCGKTTYIDEELKINDEMIKNVKNQEKAAIGEEGIKVLQNLVDIGHLLKGFDFDIRGIKNKILKKYKILYLQNGWDNFLKGKMFAYKYDEKYLYKSRDILIPILNSNGEVQRFLLRSTNPELPKKEIQVKLIPKAAEVWNVSDLLNEDKKIIFVTEGVYDALSIVSILDERSFDYSDIGIVSIPGVKKYNKVIQIIEQNIEQYRDKTIVIAFDNDKGGEVYKEKMIERLRKLGIHFAILDLYEHKDANDFLENNKMKFYLCIRNLIFKCRK